MSGNSIIIIKQAKHVEARSLVCSQLKYTVDAGNTVVTTTSVTDYTEIELDHIMHGVYSSYSNTGS